MTTYKVLVPLDGSDFSRQIFPALREHFPPDRYELLLLRVEQPPRGEFGPDTVVVRLTDPKLPRDDERAAMVERWLKTHYDTFDDHKERVERKLEEDVHALMAAGYQVSVAVHFGSPAQEIVAAVEAHRVDLVAMATHGRSGIDHLIMGSVAEYAVRHLRVPLFVVRPASSSGP